jgi:hypothetical protein
LVGLAPIGVIDFMPTVNTAAAHKSSPDIYAMRGTHVSAAVALGSILCRDFAFVHATFVVLNTVAFVICIVTNCDSTAGVLAWKYLVWILDSAGRAFARRRAGFFVAFGRLGVLARATFLAKFLLRLVGSLDGLAFAGNIVGRCRTQRRGFDTLGGVLTRQLIPTTFAGWHAHGLSVLLYSRYKENRVEQ